MFVKACTQCLTIYERELQSILSPEEESVRLQEILLPRAACILQSLLGHLSKSTFDRLLEDKSLTSTCLPTSLHKQRHMGPELLGLMVVLAQTMG